MNEKVNKKVLLASGIFAVIFASCLLLLGIFEGIVFLMKENISFIRAGERWSADGDPYAVITLYTEESGGVSLDQIGQWAFSMDAALLESSVTPKEGARSWTYCAATENTLQVSGPKGSTAAQTMAVSGDFFVFHPMTFTYGSAFLNDTSNPMGVVLDRELAWKVFGAENIIGMTVEVSGQEFTVVGVVEKESNTGVYAYTYGERPRMYMSCAGYSKIAGNVNITMFETALPNAVSSFGRNIFDRVVRMNEETSVVLEASDRFSLRNRFNNMKSLDYSWIRENKIAFPYWENEAKVADFRCAVMMVFEVIFTAAGVTSMLLSFILLRLSGYTFTDTLKNTWRKIEDKRKSAPCKQKKLTSANRLQKGGKRRGKPTASPSDRME